jgi:hypothetical protein
MKKRVERLEDYAESRNPKEGPLIIFMSCCGPEPTEEEIEAAKKKFLEEHPNHRGIIMLNFLYEGKHFHQGEEIDYRPLKQLEA